MNDRMIRTFLVTLAVLVVGCTESPEAALSPVTPEAARPAFFATLGVDVTYYWGVIYGNDECGLAATESGGDWTFPAGGGGVTLGGGSACLIAQVSNDGAPADGFVLWQSCRLPAEARPKADCDGGVAEWTTITGEDWRALAGGEYTSATHSSIGCFAAAITVGYRYLYSTRNPNERNVPAKHIVASAPFDVTSDGTLPPPDGCS